MSTTRLTTQDWMLAWVSLVHCGNYFPAELSAHLESELGVSLAEQDMLKQLDQHGSEIRMSELADRIFLSRAGVTKMVDRLTRAGLVQRTPTPGDRRAISARLTAAGRKTLNRSKRLLVEWVEREFRQSLTDRQIRDLGAALKALLGAHGRWSGQMAHLRGRSVGRSPRVD